MKIQVEKMLSNFGDCVQYKEIVQSSLEDLISGSKEVQEQAEKILDTENLFEAQQLLLHHQVGGPFPGALMQSSLATGRARAVTRTVCPRVRTKGRGVTGGSPCEWLKRILAPLFSVKY